MAPLYDAIAILFKVVALVDVVVNVPDSNPPLASAKESVPLPFVTRT